MYRKSLIHCLGSVERLLLSYQGSNDDDIICEQELKRNLEFEKDNITHTIQRKGNRRYNHITLCSN